MEVAQATEPSMSSLDSALQAEGKRSSRSLSLTVTEKKAMLEQQKTCMKETQSSLNESKRRLQLLLTQISKQQRSEETESENESTLSISTTSIASRNSSQKKSSTVDTNNDDEASTKSSSKNINLVSRRGTLKATMKNVVGKGKPKHKEMSNSHPDNNKLPPSHKTSSTTSVKHIAIESSGNGSPLTSRKGSGEDVNAGKGSEPSSPRGSTLQKMSRAISLRRKSLSVRARQSSVSSGLPAATVSMETITIPKNSALKFDFTPESKRLSMSDSAFTDETSECSNSTTGSVTDTVSVASTVATARLVRKKSVADKFRIGISNALGPKPKQDVVNRKEICDLENTINDLLLQMEMHANIVRALERQIARATGSKTPSNHSPSPVRYTSKRCGRD